MATCYNRLPKIGYLKPGSLAEAVDLLAGGVNGKVVAYAGGTDVMPRLKHRTFVYRGKMAVLPEAVVDLKGIPDLDYVEFQPETGLRIGALATVRSVATSADVRKHYPMLAHAAGSIASHQVQNRGTIAGNICNASPSADTAPSLLCLNASLVCVGTGGERKVAINDFFVGPGQIALSPEEIVREIQVPPMPAGGHGVYIKLSIRKMMDCSVAGAAAVAAVKNGTIAEARIGLGAVAPTPIRAAAAERFLVGKAPDDAVFTEAGRLAAGAASPIDDQRASAEYRKMVVPVLVKRVLEQAVKGD